MDPFDVIVSRDLSKLALIDEFASDEDHTGGSDAVVPVRFRRAVEVHLLRNLQRVPPPGTPLILGIHGPSGEGKTFQTERLLAKYGVQTILVSGGQLESGTAGEPAAIVRDGYLEAGVAITNGRHAAVLLNDADAAIGSWGSMTQYTVNTQNVVTELMHLCDYPTSVEGRKTPRVPIFITGNDFTRLYGPLCRHGRMELFEWVPTSEEREAIVGGYFPLLRPDELQKLLREHASEPLSFWGSVRLRLHDAHLVSALRGKSLREALDEVSTNSGRSPADATFSAVLAAARSVASQVPITHLEEG